MKLPARRGFISALAAALILAVMVTSFMAGVDIGAKGSAQSDGQPQNVIGGTPIPADVQAPFSDLLQAYIHLNADSYYRPFDQKQLLYQAISGLLTLPQDSHTVFSPPVEAQAISTKLNEGQAGIGAQVTMISGTGLLIQAPYFDSPAMKAGLKAGDIITAVRGKDSRGQDTWIDIRRMTADDAVNLIHGDAGTIVQLMVLRQGHGKPVAISLTRNYIPTTKIDVAGPVGYLEFDEFGINTATEVHQALASLLSQHIKYLVLDLRDNPGGYVNTAQAIASEFLAKGSVIYWNQTKRDDGTLSTVASYVVSPGIAQYIPIAVLVNSNTASAAEILAAALQENGRAKVIGTHTYGKGSEQEDITLPDQSSLRITTTLWLTPRRHEVNGTGITPDIQVQPSPSAPAQDPVLQRAIQYLLTGR